MRKYRRIKRHTDSKLQSYQISLVALLLSVVCLLFCLLLMTSNSLVSELFKTPTVVFAIASIVLTAASYFTFKLREQVSTITMEEMSTKAKRLSSKLKLLFNDKMITDVLKLSNKTRFGDEMPEIYIYVSDKLDEGYIAIENIANYERADREKFEQRVSGILAGKYQRFAVISSELTPSDSYIIFHFEDTLTSQRFIIENNQSLEAFTSQNPHVIKLAKNLEWRSDIAPHMSIIARTRAGKSVLAGRYLAKVMLSQGWIVEYNSAKYDRYVKEFSGQSDPIKIIERAEHWCSVMDERLKEINEADKEKYLEMPDMPNIALFFDELGNLNAALDSIDKVDKKAKVMARWTNAINRLSATGGSAGIHIIAISQFATKEAFLPSLARVNCSDAVVMLGGAADSADERKYLMSGFADLPKRSYIQGQGVARLLGSGSKWQKPHFYETPLFKG